MDAATAAAAAHASAGAATLAAHLGSPAQRLQRYIADIRKGFSVVIAAGARPRCPGPPRCVRSLAFGLGRSLLPAMRAARARGPGCVGGVVLSLLWMLVLRYGAGAMAWLTVAAANAGMIACTMLAYEQARAPPAWRSRAFGPQAALHAPARRHQGLCLQALCCVWERPAAREAAQPHGPRPFAWRQAHAGRVRRRGRACTQSGLLGSFGSVGAALEGAFPLAADPSAGDRRIWAISAYTLSALSALLLLLTLVMIRRIRVRAAPASAALCATHA